MIKFKTKINQFNKYFFVFLLLSIILLLVIFPSTSIKSFYEGILIWATKVLPALLPFFILTKLLSYTQFISTLGKKFSPITKKLYHVGGISGYVYIMSIVSGYPVGAKLTSDLYSNKVITKKQAMTITSFTSTSGPLFVLGTVGIGLFNNTQLGYIILISHYIGALLNGLIYRQKDTSDTIILSTQKSDNFLNESMTSSILSIMTVGGFIALFYMILHLLLSINAFEIFSILFNLLGVSSEVTTPILAGIFEVTTGCIMLSNTTLNIDIITIILSFLISFGGISIHAQAYCFLKNFDMPYSKFLLQKFTHAILSLLITVLIIVIF